MSDLTRSQFLKLMAASAASLSGVGSVAASEAGTSKTSPAPEGPREPRTSLRGSMPYRDLGRTGEQVSLLGMGGFHLALDSLTQAQTDSLVHHAIGRGVNFFDTARGYMDGKAEKRLGHALRGGYREKAFLMTKNCGHDRTRASAMQSLEASLRALGTDHIDLWLFHEVIYDNDPEWILELGGLAAALEAKQQGKVRFLGFSGHKSPAIHLDLIERVPSWDVVMMPLNIFDHHFRSFERQVLPVCNARGMGTIGMKSLGGFLSDMLYRTKIPYQDCLRYCFHLPVSTMVVGMENPEQLEKNLAVVEDFRGLAPEEVERIRALSRPFAGDGRFEKYKTMAVFDGTPGKKAHGFPH